MRCSHPHPAGCLGSFRDHRLGRTGGCVGILLFATALVLWCAHPLLHGLEPRVAGRDAFIGDALCTRCHDLAFVSAHRGCASSHSQATSASDGRFTQSAFPYADDQGNLLAGPSLVCSLCASGNHSQPPRTFATSSLDIPRDIEYRSGLVEAKRLPALDCFPAVAPRAPPV